MRSTSPSRCISRPLLTCSLAVVLLLTGVTATALAQELAFVFNRGKFKKQSTTVTVIDFSTRKVLGDIENAESNLRTAHRRLRLGPSHYSPR